MRILNDASCLFFNSGYKAVGISVFNAVDAATGAPSVPATGAPEQEPASESNTNLDSLKTPIEDIQDHISTLQQMGATSDADQQQSALEAKLGEFKKALDGLSESCQSLIIKYRQEGVPNLDAGAQGGAGQAAAGAAPGMDAGMAMGADPMAGMGMGADPMAGMGAAPGGEMAAPPAGASAPGMTTYDDLMQQNQQGVTGQGGSTIPPM